MSAEAAHRVAAVVAEVVRAAVRDAGASGVVVLDDDSPEAALAVEWCSLGLGAGAVHAVPRPEAAAAAELIRGLGSERCPAEVEMAEVHRLRGRLVAAARDALLAHPANKTALLLAPMPPEPILPLGDLYASQVAAIMGAWSAPAPVVELAREAGGIDRLDAALTAIVEERREADAVLALLPSGLGPAVGSRLDAGRFLRRRVGLVPKLGARTLGIDFFA